MTIIRQRLPESVFDRVFVWVLKLLEQKGLLRGKAVAVDATPLEANAAMKSIVRKVYTLKCAAYNLGVLLRKVWGLRKPRNADEGVWGGLWAGLAWLTLAAVIVYRVTTRPESLLWDMIGLVLITAMARGAVVFTSRPRKRPPFLTGC
jgi:transposase